MSTTPHRCHAKGCKMPVPPRFLMCPYHWKMVPNNLQRLVWKHYQQGQEIGKDPTPHYVAAATAAVNAVADLETRRSQPENRPGATPTQSYRQQTLPDGSYARGALK